MIRAGLAFLLLLVPFTAPSAAAHGPPAEGGPDTVFVAAVITDIDRIDTSDQSFSINLFLVLRWRDPALAAPGVGSRRLTPAEAGAPSMVIVNRGGNVRTALPDLVEVDSTGWALWRQMYVGSFSQPMDLRDFPFDRQAFRVQLAFPGASADRFHPAADPRWGEAIPGAFAVMDSVTLPDWKVEGETARPLPYVVVPGVSAPGYALEFRARRHSGFFVWKMILPLVLIVMMSWSVFWIDPESAGTQIGVATSSILTLIAYRFTVGIHLPPIPYMTRMDNFILASTILVFLTLLQVILTSALTRNGRHGVALGIDRASRLVFPALFAVTVWALLLA